MVQQPHIVPRTQRKGRAWARRRKRTGGATSRAWGTTGCCLFTTSFRVCWSVAPAHRTLIDQADVRPGPGCGRSAAAPGTWRSWSLCAVIHSASIRLHAPEGNSKREIMRCLERYIVREVYSIYAYLDHREGTV